MRLIRSILDIAILAAAATTVFVGCGDNVHSDAQAQHQTDSVRKGTFEFFIGEDGQHYFRLVSSDGTKLLRSEGYTAKAKAEVGVASVMNNGVDRSNYSVLLADDGRWYFNLVAQNHEIIATSSTLFSAESHANAAVELVQSTLSAMDQPATPFVTCRLERLATMPQGAGTVSATIDVSDGDSYAASAGIDVFDMNYNFDISPNDGTLIVFFYENNVVLDEVGSLGCDLPVPLKAGTVFCQEPIIIDVYTEESEDEEAHAFDFSCHID